MDRVEPALTGGEAVSLPLPTQPGLPAARGTPPAGYGQLVSAATAGAAPQHYLLDGAPRPG